MTEATRSLLDPDGSPTRADSARGGDLPEQIGRYRIEGEIARGGMGVVLRAADPDLGRTLAVKVLLARHEVEPAAVRRFLEEARLCGQLQHPGIPPVHELGTLPDGRPFFAMKLVKGDTLAKLLAQRSGPADDLPRHIQIFEQICQTVAYAHSRGVLHRDLKPANVMVGAFGEVQVMDWGLAKILRGPNATNETTSAMTDLSTLYSMRAGVSPEETQPGSVLGTPAYMPPEQARGQVAHLDERADVYALGAILCVILTGRPPHQGGDPRDTIRRAAEGDLTTVRSRLQNADADLARLCLACLAFQPAERPRDTAAVAQVVAAYRAGVEQRLRQAEIARAEAEVRASEEGKRRRVLLAWAGSVLAFVVVAACAVFWIQRDWAVRAAEKLQQEAAAQAEASALERDVTTALADTRRSLEAANWPEAQASLGKAEGRLGHAGTDELRARLAQTRDELALGMLLDGLEFSRDDALRCAAEFERAGFGTTTVEPAVAAARVAASPLRKSLLAALDRWAGGSTSPKQAAWVLEVARRVDPHPWRDRLRNPGVWGAGEGQAALARVVAQVPVEALQPHLAAAVGYRLGRLPAAEQILRRAVEHLPDSHVVHFTLARELDRQGRPADAEGHWRAAVALRPEAWSFHHQFGVNLEKQGKDREAEVRYRRAVELGPTQPSPCADLASLLQRQGRHADVRELFHQATEQPTDDPRILATFAHFLAQNGRLAEASARYRAAIARSPAETTDRSGHGGYAALLSSFGQEAEAEAVYREGLRRNPVDAFLPISLARLLIRQGRFDEAEALCADTIRLVPDYFSNHRMLGEVYWSRGKAAEAEAAFRAAIRLSPGDILSHQQLHTALAAAGRLDQSREVIRRLVHLHPQGSTSYRLPQRLLTTCEAQIALDRDLAEYLAERLQPADGPTALLLADLCALRRHNAAAVRFFALAFALDPVAFDSPFSEARLTAACCAARAGDEEEALRWLRADFAFWSGVFSSGKEADRHRSYLRILQWQRSPQLAPLRESSRWRPFWADVDALRTKALTPQP